MACNASQPPCSTLRHDYCAACISLIWPNPCPKAKGWAQPARQREPKMPFDLESLKRAFAESGMGLGELAAKVGKDKSTVSRYLTGKVPMTVEMLDAIAEALGVPVTRFYDREDAARTPEERAALLLMRKMPADALQAQLALWASTLPKD